MTIDYVPIANNPGANVTSQAQYLIDIAPLGSLEDGYESGVALSAQVNKTVRQSSVMSAAIANFIGTATGSDVLDDGNVAALTALFLAAIQATIPPAFTTGDVKLTMKTAADSTWILCNDGTFGDASSGATTRANADTLALYTLLWNNVNNAYCPVSTGRGANAAADFAAHKTIQLNRTLGRAIAIYGLGSGLTAQALGQYLGNETKALSTGELATHSHTVSDPTHAHTIQANYTQNGNDGAHLSGGLPVSYPTQYLASGTEYSATGISLGNAGSGTAFSIQQPTTFMNAMIKL